MAKSTAKLGGPDLPFLCLFQVCVTLGTTGACAFDKLREVGPICEYWLILNAIFWKRLSTLELDIYFLHESDIFLHRFA